jgi:cell wall-associated NlpC family hydrolase
VTRVIHRRAGALLAGAAALAVIGTLCGPTGATADPLADAKARAAALSRQVADLTQRTEIVSQRYDAIEARLNGAVTSSFQADQAETAARARAKRVKQRLDNRVQALYASAGSFGMFSAFLSGSAADAVEGDQLSASVLALDTVQASRDRTAVDLATTEAGRRQLTAQQVTRLQARAAARARRINVLLAQQRHALSTADATVRRLVVQDQREAEQASVVAFQGAATASNAHLSGALTPPNSVAAAAIAAARSRLGVPYVWGATGPDSFDCSGLTQWSYAHAGITLPRTAAEQWFSGPHPSLSQLEPGDLLFYAYDLNDPESIHHVTMYLGNGLMIAAPQTGENVQIQPVYDEGYLGATRPWAGH